MHISTNQKLHFQQQANQNAKNWKPVHIRTNQRS